MLPGAACPLEDAVAWEGVALSDPRAEAVLREAEAAPLPQGLGDALALSGERVERALLVRKRLSATTGICDATVACEKRRD